LAHKVQFDVNYNSLFVQRQERHNNAGIYME